MEIPSPLAETFARSHSSQQEPQTKATVLDVLNAQKFTPSSAPRVVSKSSALPHSTIRPVHHMLSPAKCPFETALNLSRRRIPYSTGTGRITPRHTAGEICSYLTKEQEQAISSSIQQTYYKMLPSEDSKQRKALFVQKLELMLNDEWPGNSIKVHAFGSTENQLCTDDSDVDVCITTPWTELNQVCKISALLHKHGLEKIVCIPKAKVPIVRTWDPQLRVACDMNVNNSLAIVNTRLVKTYVEIDSRVRVLAMMIKYWAKRRVLNDAMGATLTSYTWTCLVINFLQMRDPPVLPVLHQIPHEKKIGIDGTDISFADDVDRYNLRDFGKANTETIGGLFFAFFKLYAYDFDYSKDVVSVRHGKLLNKAEKGWNIGTNNMFCVEEPFNTNRNLGNTADDISQKGLHIEFRRAYHYLVDDICFEAACAQYEFKPEARTEHDSRTFREQFQQRYNDTSSSKHSQARTSRSGAYWPRQYSNHVTPNLSFHPGDPYHLNNPDFFLVPAVPIDHLQYLNNGIQQLQMYQAALAGNPPFPCFPNPTYRSLPNTNSGYVPQAHARSQSLPRQGKYASRLINHNNARHERGDSGNRDGVAVPLEFSTSEPNCSRADTGTTGCSSSRFFRQVDRNDGVEYDAEQTVGQWRLPNRSGEETDEDFMTYLQTRMSERDRVVSVSVASEGSHSSNGITLGSSRSSPQSNDLSRSPVWKAFDLDSQMASCNLGIAEIDERARNIPYGATIDRPLVPSPRTGLRLQENGCSKPSDAKIALSESSIGSRAKENYANKVSPDSYASKVRSPRKAEAARPTLFHDSLP